MELYKTILVALTSLTLFLLVCSLSDGRDKSTTIGLILMYVAYLVYFILN